MYDPLTDLRGRIQRDLAAYHARIEAEERADRDRFVRELADAGFSLVELEQVFWGLPLEEIREITQSCMFAETSVSLPAAAC